MFGVARPPSHDGRFRDKWSQSALADHVPARDLDPQVARRFGERLHYARLDAASGEDWGALSSALAEAKERVRVFYLATRPTFTARSVAMSPATGW